MAQFGSGRRAPAVLGACVAAVFASLGPAQAVITSTSDALPLLGVPYTIPGGNCFPTAGFCVAGGAFTLTSPAPGLYGQYGSNEFFTTYATDTVDLTRYPSMTPAGTVTLNGTIEQEVLGRAGLSDIGSWTADLVSVMLTGRLAGHPLTLTLNPADTSSGTTSITPINTVNLKEFSVNSFFDVFAEVSYNGLTATPSGTATAPVTSAPEPATLALLAAPLLVMSAVRRRRR